MLVWPETGLVGQAWPKSTGEESKQYIYTVGGVGGKVLTMGRASKRILGLDSPINFFFLSHLAPSINSPCTEKKIVSALERLG